MVLADPPPPPPPELDPPPQPAAIAAASSKSPQPVNVAYMRRRAANLVPSRNKARLKAAISPANQSKGEIGRPGPDTGAGPKSPGGKAEIVVVSCAVQNAPVPVFTLKPVGVQVADPSVVPPFIKVTEPVGPVEELLDELTTAVKTTLPPEFTLVTLGLTETEVEALVIVTESVLLLEFEL